MVKGSPSFRSVFATLFLAAASLLCAAPPDYNLGDTAQDDVIAPVAFSVLNVEATDELKQRESGRVPMIFRVNPIAAQEAEAELRASFSTARSSFDEAMQRTMKNASESERGVGSPLFRKTVTAAKRRAAGFPLMDVLAPVWARNDSDEVVQAALLRELRAVMKRPIIASRVGGYNPRGPIHLVTVTALDEALTPKDVEQRAKNARGDEVLPLPQAQRQIKSNLIPELSVAGPFLAGFLRTNAMADVELTRLIRLQRTKNLAVMDRYEAGQLILRKGQLVDAKALGALTALREKQAITTLETKLAGQQSGAPQSKEGLYAIAEVGFGIILAFLLLILRRLRAVESNTLLPALAREPEQLAEGELAWRERALLAEAHAEQARQVVKVGFMQWMREKLVSGLFHQRAQLLSSQQGAAAEIRALHDRLEQLHAPLQERIAAYEARIAELEKELAAKGEENRELIKAKITLAKHQLSLERERSRAEFGTN